MRVYVGGTFDPPHLGHLVAGMCALAQFGAERVTFLPAGDPYRKSGSTGQAAGHVEDRPSPAEVRLEMLRLAIADNPAFDIDDRETLRESATYTVDTLRELAAEGIERPVFVFGSDAVRDMKHWKEPAEITRMARIAVAPKFGVELAEGELPPGAEPLAMPVLQLSSTEIRRRVRAGEPIRYLVPPAVEEFVRIHELYRAAR
jgi:nicotinate-nucleotide adenylyltransferase